MRALPADSVEYLGATAVGKTALPAAVPAGAGAAGAASFVSAFGAAAGAAAGVVAAGFAALLEHSALRNSFHFIPLRVPAVCAALYFALHSWSDIAEAVPAHARLEAVTAMTA